MSPEEMHRYIQFLFTQLEDIKEELRRANAIIAENASEQKRLNALVLSLTNQLNDALQKIQNLLLENESLKSSLRVFKKQRFSSSTQKGIVKKEESNGRDDGKDDFDGTSANVQTSIDSESIEVSFSVNGNQNRVSRKGCSNSKMSADYQVFHRCDMNQIPSDAIILKKSIRKVFDSVNLIVEHDFEEVTYKTSDGRIITNYFPMQDDKDSSVYNERVHRTHATGNLLSTLAFNRYQLSTPAYREMARMVEMKMSISRQTLINWYGKMANKLNNLIPAMKDEALHEGANVNVDETWCRYQSRFGHKKHYMWCIANKAAKTVIFFYDEGKRNRNVLREFLGDAKIHSLQSDGYNVYMYLDDGLHDIEHLCCMAHVRAKFKYAYEQGNDARAKYFLDKIGWLYNQEKIYRQQGLTVGEIKDERNSDNVNQVITDLRNKLDYHLYFDKVTKGDLMQKAINYMHTF